MAKESITVNCYPSEEKINQTIKRYEAFGWELANNQNFSEYTDYGRMGSVTETYTVLTFSREKSVQWYESVVNLEGQYNALNEQLEDLNKSKPKQPQTSDNGFLALMLFIFGGIVGFVGLLLLGISFTGALEFYWSFIPIGISIALVLGGIACILKKKKNMQTYEKQLETWGGINDGKVERLESQMRDLQDKAYNLTNSQ